MSGSNHNRGMIRSEFYRSVQAAYDAMGITDLATIVPSTVGSERYVLGNTPDVPVLRGNSTPIKQFSGLPWDIVNGEYLSGMEVGIADYERDQTGQTKKIAGQMGLRCGQLWSSHQDALLLNGESEPTYNGQNLFDTQHQVGKSPEQSNLLTGTEVPALSAVSDADAPTPEEFVDVVTGMIGYMMTYMDDANEPLHEMARSFSVFVHPLVFSSAITGVSANLLGGGNTPKTSVLQGTGGFKIKVYARPRLTEEEDVFVARTDCPGMSAMILQEETKPRITFMGPGSEYADTHFKYRTNAYMRGAVGTGEPLMITKGTMS